MAETEVRSNIKNVRQTLTDLPMRAKLALADGLDHATRSFYSEFYKRRLQGYPGIQANPKGIFHRFRRITMVNGKKVFISQNASQNASVRAIAKSSKDALHMRVELYTTSKVASIHETGGTISGKGMPIPLNAEAQSMIKNHASLENLESFVINGKFFLGRKGFLGKPVLLFIIKRTVRIKARLGFYATWDAHEFRRNQIIDDAWDDAMDKA